MWTAVVLFLFDKKMTTNSSLAYDINTYEWKCGVESFSINVHSMWEYVRLDSSAVISKTDGTSLH